jgi:diguanylate cyclase (GGDEF)-like protein
LDTVTAALSLTVAVALIGALVGAAGFAFLIVGLQNRRLARIAERLARAEVDSPMLAADARRIRDRRLRAAFTELADRVAQTWEQATIDPLTRIANRQTVLTRVEEELARAARYRRPLSLILVDLDHFKRFNDSHGHAAGDVILRHVAQLLAENVRAVDLAGRYGGEEFLIVLPETDADAAASLAEKLRRIVGGSEIRLPDNEVVAVTMSAGVAGGQGEVLRLDALIRDADAALYSAKALGRNQVYVFREIGDDGTVRRAPITAEARSRAIDVGKAAMGAAQDALIATLAGRPAWGGKPSTMIADASVALARAIDLPEGELERIRTASLLHDLGKLAIPEEILAKPGDLAASEWRVVTEHPKIGQVVLEQAGALRDAATIVLHHHEWYDGRGYPHGLAGGEIPVGARIVSIVDAYEAMVAGRPYRAAISHEEAIAELRRQGGVQFDPELVEVFAEVFASGVPWAIEHDGSGHGHVHPHDHDHVAPWDHVHDEDAEDGTDAGVPVLSGRARNPGGVGRHRIGAIADHRTTAEIHDAVHERRRRAV